MYNGIIIVLTILAFCFIIASVFAREKQAKMILIGIALVMFAGLSIGSAHIQVYSCDNYVVNSTTNGTYDFYNYERTCNSDGFYDEGSMWVFASFGFVCAVLMLIIGIMHLDVAD